MVHPFCNYKTVEPLQNGNPQKKTNNWMTTLYVQTVKGWPRGFLNHQKEAGFRPPFLPPPLPPIPGKSPVAGRDL